MIDIPVRAPKPPGAPCDHQAEHGVIGAVLLDERWLQIPAVAQLRVTDFSDDAHARLWEVVRREREQGKPLDLQVIARRLAEQPGEPLGLPFITKLIDSAGTGSAAEYFAEVLLDKSRLRRQFYFAHKLQEQIAAGLPSDDVAGFIERHNEEERQQAEVGEYVLRSFADMSKNIKGLKPVVIEGLLRESEVANLISVPKIGKSWMGAGLLLSVATGTSWLHKFATTPGDVLLVDNELHIETISHRIPQVADAMSLQRKEYDNRLFVHCLRGRLVDINGLAALFNRIEPGRFKLIVLDALYRLLPDGSEENSNSDVKRLYDKIDQYAERTRAAFVCVHHASKGSQSGKSTTDVGSGAGSQSRAADSHIVLRQHEQEGAIVLDGNVRSFPPIEPICLRWEFPVWQLAEDLDPRMLKPDRPAKAPKQATPEEQAKEEAAKTTPQQFVAKFVTGEPQTKDAIILAAQQAGLTKARATQLFGIVTGNQAKFSCYRWLGSDRRQKVFANQPQTTLIGEESAA